MKTIEKNTPQEKDILVLIKELGKELRVDCDNRLAEFGLTTVQGRVLFHIAKWTDEGKEVHQNDLEKHWNLSKSTVSGIISRLEKKQLVMKISNHPYFILKVTEKGMNIIEHISIKRNDTIDKLLKGLSEKEKEQMINNIKRCINNLKEE
mgnify:CR=1 FL=1